MFNYSIISTNDECCRAIANYRNCTKLFAKLFSKYPGRQDIVVRLGYALGNLLAKSDDIRLQVRFEIYTIIDFKMCLKKVLLFIIIIIFFSQCLKLLEADGAMDILLDLLELYLKKDLELASREMKETPQKEQNLSLESGSDGSIEDVIVKVRCQNK